MIISYQMGLLAVMAACTCVLGGKLDLVQAGAITPPPLIAVRRHPGRARTRRRHWKHMASHGKPARGP